MSDYLAFYDVQVKILDLCEFFIESYVFIEKSLGDILVAIPFSRLKIQHSSRITRINLFDSL